MSKKVSEFDRYERMKRLEKEAEAERRKSDIGYGRKNKKNRGMQQTKGRFMDFDDDYDYWL